MTKKVRMLLLTAMLLFSAIYSGNRLSAQNTLGFDSIGLIGMPDTVANGENWLIGAFIKNYSQVNSLINDSVQIVCSIDTSSTPTLYYSPWVDSVSLAPNDTIFFILPILFDAGSGGNGFRIGNNVIVVWPITNDPAFDTTNAVTVNVFVATGIGTGPEPEVGEVRFYPVPASGPLYVTSSNRSLVVKEITVRDAAGKIIAVSQNPAAGIGTDEWATGIYLLEVTFDNGTRSTYKIVR